MTVPQAGTHHSATFPRPAENRTLSHVLSIESGEISEDPLNENRPRLFMQSLLQQGVSHFHLGFSRNLKAGRGVGKLYSGRNGKLQVCPDWRLREAAGGPPRGRISVIG